MPLLTTELAHAIDEALSPDLPCEGWAEDDNPAIWWCISSCPCGPWAFCALCHQRALSIAAFYEALRCRTCDEIITVRYEPIR